MKTKTEETKSDKPKGQFTIKGVILSYPHLTEAHKATPTSDPRYGAELRIPKTNVEDYQKLRDFIDELKKAKEKEKIRVFDSDICLKDGDTFEKRKPEHAGFWLLSANKSEKQGPPDLYGRKHSAGKLPNESKPEKDAIEKMFYPGLIVNAVVGIYFSSKGGNKICATLEVVQKWQDGERLGQGGSASLDDLPDAEDDEDDNLDDDEAPALD